MSETNSAGTVNQLPVKTVTQTQPTIQAKGLTKVFGNRTVVDRLSISVYPGELYALLGENGAGKTTTINMLTTLLSPTAGTFSICGFDGMREPEKVKGCFGVVSQDVAIYQELTAYENLAFVADLYGIPSVQARPRIEKLLVEAGLADRANDLAGELSMGMQRKLSIATAMLPEPKVLFMDEPTVGLDPASRRQIWASLRELRGHGVTVLLTTHYLEEAELLAERIGIIRQGRLVLEGTIEELRSKIEGIRTIAVTLSRRLDNGELSAKIDKLKQQFPTEAHYDAVRNTLYFAQPKNVRLVQCLDGVVEWLEGEKIPFSKCATSEPSLEEIYLAVALGQQQVDLQVATEGSDDIEMEGI
ncbi:MAG TPA: ABC transporter ATP-binding protein [Candidatus Obscuribacterales bacterium]